MSPRLGSLEDLPDELMRELKLRPNINKIEKINEIEELRKLGWTFQEIANQHGVSRQAIQQFINKKKTNKES